MYLKLNRKLKHFELRGSYRVCTYSMACCHLIRLLKIENGIRGNRVLKVTEKMRKLSQNGGHYYLRYFQKVRSFVFKNN